MNIPGIRLIILLLCGLLSITSLSAGDTKYFTEFIHSTDAPLKIEVPANRYMEVIDFKTSQVQNEVGRVVAFRGPLTSVVVAVANTDKRVVLAGPITAAVNPVPGTTLFITYLLGRN